jgi:uncharacterized protein YndB with AHSA1/START domain
MEEARLIDKPSLTLTREYAAAPEKVWKAWTDPQAVSAWWGEPGDKVSGAELDVRVGGRFRIRFGGPDGNANECAGEYREVVKNRRLVFSWSWPRSTPDRVSQVTILFNPKGAGTELIFKHEGLFDDKARDNHKRGWSAFLTKLDEFLR